MSPRGFAPPRPAPRTVAVWFSCYAQDNEDESLTAALRAAALYCTRERWILMAIADELEGGQ